MASLASSAFRQAGRRLGPRNTLSSRIWQSYSRIASPVLPSIARRGYVSESKKDEAQALGEAAIKVNNPPFSSSSAAAAQARDPSTGSISGMSGCICHASPISAFSIFPLC